MNLSRCFCASCPLLQWFAHILHASSTHTTVHLSGQKVSSRGLLKHENGYNFETRSDGTHELFGSPEMGPANYHTHCAHEKFPATLKYFRGPMYIQFIRLISSWIT